MTGSEKWFELFKLHKDRPILLYGDPDVDGLFSLYLMCKFCDMLGLECSYYINDNRSHGFILDPSILEGYMVISADFSMTRERVDEILSYDVVLLSTDHHEIDEDMRYIEGSVGVCSMLNNQYEFEPDEDRYLSGAGVFYEHIVSIFPEFRSDTLEALVGITLLSDIRQIENKKAKYYLNKTYSANLNDVYIQHLLRESVISSFNFGAPKIDRNFVDFTLSPKINALLRFNRTVEAIDFIINGGKLDESYREKQKELINNMLDVASVLELSSLHILAIDEDLVEYSGLSSFVGLSCTKYADRAGIISVLGFTHKNGVVTRASFRGKYDGIDYNSTLRSLGLNTQGHKEAFGILDFKPRADLWEKLNDMVVNLESGYKSSIRIFDCMNLSLTMRQRGNEVAYENCYVRDSFRTYFRYKGNSAEVVKETYALEEFSEDDYKAGLQDYIVKNGIRFKYILNANGEKIVKYREYSIDSVRVKSFGTEISDGLILPILENGYVTLYLRNMIV